MTWLVSVLSYGLVFFYWYYRINRDLQDDGEDVEPVKALLAVTLGAFLAIPFFVSLYRTGRRIQNVLQRRGLDSGNVGLVGLLLTMLFYTTIVYYQHHLNRAWATAGPRPSSPIRTPRSTSST